MVPSHQLSSQHEVPSRRNTSRSTACGTGYVPSVERAIVGAKDASADDFFGADTGFRIEFVFGCVGCVGEGSVEDVSS